MRCDEMDVHSRSFILETTGAHLGSFIRLDVLYAVPPLVAVRTLTYNKDDRVHASRADPF